MTDARRIVATVIISPIVTGFVTGLIFFVTRTEANAIVLILGMGFGLLYGLMAGLLLSYNLGTTLGAGALLLDLTWCLPSTVVGFVLGNLIYIFFGNPSRAYSKDEGWISYKPRGSSGFGVDVLQTIGTVNLGGRGAHEKVHLLQARIFGPLFIPIVIVNYILTGLVQILFTATLGWILKAAGKRPTAYLTPPSGPDGSAVGGFFGWIYYATIFELWAYATEH